MVEPVLLTVSPLLMVRTRFPLCLPFPDLVACVDWEMSVDMLDDLDKVC